MGHPPHPQPTKNKKQHAAQTNQIDNTNPKLPKRTKGEGLVRWGDQKAESRVSTISQ